MAASQRDRISLHQRDRILVRSEQAIAIFKGKLSAYCEKILDFNINRFLELTAVAIRLEASNSTKLAASISLKR
ncbi:hypothetical protein QQ054_27860 [Oscillatoria amoena NRMC-F 0135]|uniref:Uncharacterized protein n=2 Tax=Desertifilum tharense IPPAS B-1220 TaxID=1781255 RepID=A0A1E5QGH6_9CYAN|nr:hypothetical protein [Geitlerinema splendidum]MDL5049834.1 hypothetical protein [Oscillatoria amoena NRMC-F 0135]OEJ73800.1 hypothetical protein BH720_18050 [Desertifilum tharense IPPAS B-1220]